jgi:hypothetical protein
MPPFSDLNDSWRGQAVVSLVCSLISPDSALESQAKMRGARVTRVRRDELVEGDTVRDLKLAGVVGAMYDAALCEDASDELIHELEWALGRPVATEKVNRYSVSVPARSH